MGDMLYEKIIERMKKKKDLSLKAFTKEMSFVRFNERDSKRIIDDMRRRGMIRVNGSSNNRRILIIDRRNIMRRRRRV